MRDQGVKGFRESASKKGIYVEQQETSRQAARDSGYLDLGQKGFCQFGSGIYLSAGEKNGARTRRLDVD